jgi:type IV pilus assembly protein PilB
VNRRKKLGELLVEAKIIDELQLKSALNYQEKWGGRLGQILIKLGMISEPRLMAFLVRQFRIPTVDFRRIMISPAILNIIPSQVAERLQVIPLFLEKDGTREALYVAMANPDDLEALDELKFLTSRQIKPVVASDQGVKDAIQYYYHRKGMITFDPGAKPSEEMTSEDLLRITREFLRSVQEGKSLPRGEVKGPEEDQLIIVDSTGEKRIPLSEPTPTASEPPSSSHPSAPALSPTSEKVLRALVDLLIAKGIITKEELRSRLKQ